MLDGECDEPLKILGFSRVFVMQEAYPESYRSLARFGLLEERAVAVNQEAYELLCGMEKKLLGDSNSGKSFVEVYELRMQVRMLVEEIVVREVVNVFH